MKQFNALMKRYLMVHVFISWLGSTAPAKKNDHQYKLRITSLLQSWDQKSEINNKKYARFVIFEQFDSSLRSVLLMFLES